MDFINQVLHGDCLEVLKDIPDNYFDSLLIDPPAGIAFMGKKWDHHKGGMLEWINWLGEILTEVNRALKPGALGLVWSIPRTSHWTGMAIELAGFRIIDIVHHANGSGFPKAQDIGKLLDGMAGAERLVVGEYVSPDGCKRDPKNRNKREKYGQYDNDSSFNITAPATPEAKQWDGWKTPALKPAIEGWWLIQKPITESSIARNILKHGVGGLNIEAGRIGTGKNEDGVCRARKTGTKDTVGNFGFHKADASLHNPPGLAGRYPANLVLSCGADCDGVNHSPDCPVTVIGDQSGSCPSGGGNKRSKNPGMWNGKAPMDFHDTPSTGTAARYFKKLPFDRQTATSIYYQAKASKSDRTCGGKVPNNHPTVKSRYLLSYFLKLITPPGGIVLDCFGGSGTTAVSAIESGFNYVVIEKEAEYIPIINQRIAATKGEEEAIAVPSQPETPNQETPSESTPTQQLSLF